MPSLVFMFPGQGSQRAAMGAPWVSQPSWSLVERASDASGRDVARLLLHAGDEELTQTDNAQLATFTLSLVVFDAAARQGLSPDRCAGHSLGEYSALVAAGAMPFEDGVALVTERGSAMRVAAIERAGTMAAVLGLAGEAVDAICRATGEVWTACDNGPGHSVVAGTQAAVAAASERAKAAGARQVVPLPVGGAFHTPLMAGATERLRTALGDSALRAPRRPVVANVDAREHDGADEWRRLLLEQLCRPVRWRESLLHQALAGADAFVEVGPGTALSGLAKRTLSKPRTFAAATPEQVDHVARVLVEGDPAPLPPTRPERDVVVAPTGGIFLPAPPSNATTAEGEVVPAGALLGSVGHHEVRSPAAGWMMGLLVAPGDQVAPGQPVATLRPL